MLRDSDLIAFVTTADATRARGFYEDTLGLELLEDGEFALAFDANGTMLRIQKVDQVTPPAGTALGWNVADITSTVGALAQRGVRFEWYEGMAQDERGIWTAPGGARVAWFKDPDGNTLSLTQFD